MSCRSWPPTRSLAYIVISWAASATIRSTAARRITLSVRPRRTPAGLNPPPGHGSSWTGSRLCHDVPMTAGRQHGPLPVFLLGLTVVTGLVDAFSYLTLGH